MNTRLKSVHITKVERIKISNPDFNEMMAAMLDKKNRLVYQWYQEDGMGWGSTDLTLRQDVARSHPRASTEGSAGTGRRASLRGGAGREGGRWWAGARGAPSVG